MSSRQLNIRWKRGDDRAEALAEVWRFVTGTAAMTPEQREANIRSKPARQLMTDELGYRIDAELRLVIRTKDLLRAGPGIIGLGTMSANAAWLAPDGSIHQTNGRPDRAVWGTLVDGQFYAAVDQGILKGRWYFVETEDPARWRVMPGMFATLDDAEDAYPGRLGCSISGVGIRRTLPTFNPMVRQIRPAGYASRLLIIGRPG